MAEITIKDPQTQATGVLNVGENTPVTSTGSEGKGVHVDNAALSVGVTEETVDDLLHTPYDNSVTIYGYPDLVLNQMLRSIGFRSVKSMKFDHFSVDQRKSTDVILEGDSLAVPAGSKVFTEQMTISIKPSNLGIFHETDQIVFKGVSGYDSNGETHKGYWLNGYVSEVHRTGADKGKIDVVLTNANPKNGGTVTIAENTFVIILGHALAEEDSKTVPSQAIPAPSEQFMQKFMTQANVTNVWLDSEKNVNWGLKDIKESVNREFLLETEKTYWFSHKAYFLDPATNKYIRTTAGFFEQLFEEGVEIEEMWEEELTDTILINKMANIFVGNRGSETRYMVSGMDFASGIFSLEGMQKQVSTNNTKREFTYDWNVWKLFNYTINNKPYSLFDLIGMSNTAVVMDKANIERCVFRPMDEDMLDLDKLAVEDSKILRCCEISSIVVKQAKAHRIIVLHKGKQETNPNGALDDAEKYAA